MKTKFYKIPIILTLAFLSSMVAFSQVSLLYVNDSDQIADSLIINYLEDLNYQITFVSTADFRANGSPYANAETYDNYDAIFFGEALGSVYIYNFHLAGYPIPCVITEAFVFKQSSNKWSWLSDEASQFATLREEDVPTVETANMLVFMGDEDTWLGLQYQADEEVYWTDATTGMDGNGINFFEDIPDAVPIAYIPHDSLGAAFPSVWVFPEGSTVTTDPNGITPVDYDIPAMIYLGCQSSGQDTATVEFLDLVDNCLRFVTGSTVSIKNVTIENGMSVYPTPTKDIVHFSFNNEIAGNAKISIYDTAGSLVKTNDSSYLNEGRNALSIDISGMTNAIYYYKVITEAKSYSGKILKN